MVEDEAYIVTANEGKASDDEVQRGVDFVKSKWYQNIASHNYSSSRDPRFNRNTNYTSFCIHKDQMFTL